MEGWEVYGTMVGSIKRTAGHVCARLKMQPLVFMPLHGLRQPKNVHHPYGSTAAWVHVTKN